VLAVLGFYWYSDETGSRYDSTTLKRTLVVSQCLGVSCHLFSTDMCYYGHARIGRVATLVAYSYIPLFLLEKKKIKIALLYIIFQRLISYNAGVTSPVNFWIFVLQWLIIIHRKEKSIDLDGGLTQLIKLDRKQ
jgi:hypothetical protein